MISKKMTKNRQNITKSKVQEKTDQPPFQKISPPELLLSQQQLPAKGNKNFQNKNSSLKYQILPPMTSSTTVPSETQILYGL